MHLDILRLKRIVQRNCHIADARFGVHYSMCVYLLRMREYYRWEKGLPFSRTLPHEAVGEWLGEREAYWESLEKEPFSRLPLGEQQIEPLDAERANEALRRHGLVYSAGLGIGCRPHFFLGALEREEHRGSMRIFIAAEELARDLASPAAMTLGETIYVRREALERALWERVEGWSWNRPDNAMGRAMQFYDFAGDVDRALPAMAERELRTALLHEIGEVQAGRALGEGWERMLVDLPRSRSELLLRAVRDHLADCLSTLPELAQENDPAAIHGYFSGLSAIRKELFPSLWAGYEAWMRRPTDRTTLRRVAEKGIAHWLVTARRALALHEARVAEDFAVRLQPLLDECAL